MTDSEFDRTLVKAAFELAAERGWDRVSVGDAARLAALPLDHARIRFPIRAMILHRFGRIADQAALAGSAADDIVEAPVRDRLFDILMRRIDVLQAHRAGVRALLRALPRHPATALVLAAANLNSMAWMLEGAGIDITGPKGALRVKGLLAVWLYTVRAWEKDDSEDLSATMAALDRALDRAEQAENSLCRGRGSRSSSVSSPICAEEPPPPAAPSDSTDDPMPDIGPAEPSPPPFD